MSKRPSHGIGKRLSTYRRMAGFSARELAELAGCGLTRGVIANIESGRKTDITVDQLIALSAVLAIPPAALALPVDEPFRFVRMSDGEHQTIMNRAHIMIDWFEGGGTWFKAPSPQLKDNPSTRFATERIVKTRDYVRLMMRVERLTLKVEEGEVGRDVLDEAIRELAELHRDLQQLEVNLTVFTVDDEVSSEQVRLLAKEFAQTLNARGEQATAESVWALLAEVGNQGRARLSATDIQQLIPAVIGLAQESDG